jgi:hypothetical protein
MDFLNQRETGMVVLSGFSPFSFTESVRGCVSLKKYKFQGIGGNILRLLSGFRPRIRPQRWFVSSYLAGRSPYISLKIKKRHYEHEHHMIEAHKYLIIWFSDDIFENSG